MSDKVILWKNTALLLDEIKKYPRVTIVGKGPTATHLTREPDTFYVGLKQSIMFLPDDSHIDLFVFTDMSGFYGVTHLIKKCRFILCSFYPHGWNDVPNLSFSYKYVQDYTQKLGFTGTLCFAQVGLDPFPDKNVPIFKVLNSGEFFFDVCKEALMGKEITTFGMNKGTGYHKEIIELVRSLQCSNDEMKNWVNKFNNSLVNCKSQMTNPRFQKTKNDRFKNKFPRLNINYM